MKSQHDEMQAPTSPSTQDQIAVEQCRFLLTNLGSSVLPGILVVALVYFALHDKTHTFSLQVWAAVVTLSKLVDYADARRLLAMDTQHWHMPTLRIRLTVLHAIDGLAWGSLVWVGLPMDYPQGWILSVAVIAGVAGNSMSILSSVMPAFVGFLVMELGVVALMAFTQDDLSMGVLGAAVLMYVVTLMIQARNSNQTIRQAIVLRFENSELLARLQAETKNTQIALQEAELANIAKTKFLAAASHDLRQPVQAQLLFLDVLKRTALAPSQAELLENVRSATSATADMLSHMLEYSRIESKAFGPALQNCDVQLLLRKIENNLAPQAEAKGLYYRSRDTQAVVYSDPMLLEQMLRNLVQNAIRYTHQGGLLVVCRPWQGRWLLQVWDSGIGIEASKQEEIFLEFHQLGNPERDHRKGLGLGLAIVKGLSQLLQHPLSVRSRLGRGSVFQIVLPPAQGAAIAPVAPASAWREVAPMSLRILLIEDDDLVRQSTTSVLQSWGFTCCAVSHIEQAVAALTDFHPEIIISDYRLREERTGLQAIAAVRATAGWDIPALITTGDTAPARLQEAVASGLPLLHKPVSPEQLHAKIVSLVLSHKSKIG